VIKRTTKPLLFEIRHRFFAYRGISALTVSEAVLVHKLRERAQSMAAKRKSRAVVGCSGGASCYSATVMSFEGFSVRAGNRRQRDAELNNTTAPFLQLVNAHEPLQRPNRQSDY